MDSKREDFIIPASDTKGHNTRQWFRCIPAMSGQVEQIVQSKKFPYRTKGDLLRHALHRHVKWLSSAEPTATVSGQVDAMLEILKDDEKNNDFSLVLERLNKRISQHIDAGSQREATRLVLIMQSSISEMPEGFWRDKYEKELKKRYGRLVDKTDKCNFGEIE